MIAYLIRRLLLVIPTLFGIMCIQFTVMQFAPGGPVERMIAIIEQGSFDEAATRMGGDTSMTDAMDDTGGSGYTGSQGLSPEVIKEIEEYFGFDKPAHVRFFEMLWNFIRFDFGKSYYRDEYVINIVFDAMLVTLQLAIWTTCITYLVSIPLGVRKAIKDGSRFDMWTSGFVIVGNAVPGFLFAVFLVIMFCGGSYLDVFPMRGLHSMDADQLGFFAYIIDYFHHLILPVTCLTIASFAFMTMLTKNNFLDELHKLYVMTARAKGLVESRVLYGHVFRNAMLIPIAGFPRLFVMSFFMGSFTIEIIFSIRGMGQLMFTALLSRDYPIMFTVLYMQTIMGLLVHILSDFLYTVVDPRIDFEKRG